MAEKKATNVIFYLFLFLVFLIILQSINYMNTKEIEITYSEFEEILNKNTLNGQPIPKIKKAIILKKDINTYEFIGYLEKNASISLTPNLNTEDNKMALIKPSQIKFRKFKVILPMIDSEMLEKWNKYGFQYRFKEKGLDWVSVFISFLPWLFFIGLWVLMMRQINGGGGKGVFNFGKSRAKLITEADTKVTFNDVAGCDEAKEELKEVVEFLKDPGKFQRLGGKLPKGVLLVGPPGTGKTLLAKAVAGEAGVPFFAISGSDFVEMFVGVGAARVRDLFDKGRKYAPCILFIDEIDAVARQRGAGLGGGHDEREQTLNQLLVEMDGMDTKDGIIVIAATNRPDILDPAILRPGRFDRQIVIDRPDMRGREGILKVHIRKQNIPIADDVDLEVIAKTTPGLSGAELANIVNEAALLAARENVNKVYMRHFEQARDKVMLGLERKSRKISEKERKITAYHEAGHALCAYYIPEADKVHKVSIIPRGMALGITHTLPEDDKYTYSKSYLLAEIAVLLGGRAAELLIFNEETTGAGNDIKRATEIARKMVCEWGMSDRIGPIALEEKKELVFLGREIEKTKEYSEKVAEIIDEEVKRIIYERMEFVLKLLNEHKQELIRIGEALLKYETINYKQMENLIKCVSIECGSVGGDSSDENNGHS